MDKVKRILELVPWVFTLIPWADAAIENAWNSRNWSAFAKLWLVFTLAITVVVFVIVLVPGAFYLEGMRIQQFLKVRDAASTAPTVSQFMALQYYYLWNFAWGFALITGIGTLVSAVPVMLMKQFFGEPKSE